MKESNPNCHVVLSSPIDILDDEKATLTIKRLNRLLSESSLDIIDNSNTGHSFLGMHGLHLNGIRISGSAKQKVKEVHSKISSF